MNKRFVVPGIALFTIAALAVFCFFIYWPAPPGQTLKVGIAPYQDMAMLMNIEPLGLEKQLGTEIELVSMKWDDLTPAVASAGHTVDVAFASLIQFVSQEASLNSASNDPIVFFYPAYVFKGGAFVTFNENMPQLTRDDLVDKVKVEAFLRHRFAVQKTSSYEMLLSQLARSIGRRLSDLNLIDVGSEEGLLAAQNGSVDATSAGLTQKNEALREGGKVVLEMGDLGQVDIAGFVAKRSTIEEKRKEIEAFLQMWTISCKHSLDDIEHSSQAPLDYLKKSSSTHYTIEEFKRALEQEILPHSLKQLEDTVIKEGSMYDFRRVVEVTANYYIETGTLKKQPNNITILTVTKNE